MQSSSDQLTSYENELRRFDWQFEYSDDHSVWREGKTKLAALRKVQQLLDHNKEIWNKYAPKD